MYVIFSAGISKTDDDLMDAWLNIAHEKKELKEKEAKLMLKYVLMLAYIKQIVNIYRPMLKVYTPLKLSNFAIYCNCESGKIISPIWIRTLFH